MKTLLWCSCIVFELCLFKYIRVHEEMYQNNHPDGGAPAQQIQSEPEHDEEPLYYDDELVEV